MKPWKLRLIQLLPLAKIKVVLVYHLKMKKNPNKEGSKLEDRICTILLDYGIRRWKRSNGRKELPVQHAEIKVGSQMILFKTMMVAEGLGDQDASCEDQIILNNHLGPLFKFQQNLVH